MATIYFICIIRFRSGWIRKDIQTNPNKKKYPAGLDSKTGSCTPLIPNLPLLVGFAKSHMVERMWDQRWDQIRITGVDSGGILRFFRTRIRSQNLGKTGTGPLFNFGRSRGLCGQCLGGVCVEVKTWVNYGNRWLYTESEQESDSQIWKIGGPGFKHFRTGAHSESEKVTPATSVGDSHGRAWVICGIPNPTWIR